MRNLEEKVWVSITPSGDKDDGNFAVSMFSFWIFWILEVALTYKMTEITLFVNVVHVLGFIYQCELVINQYSFYLSYFIYYYYFFDG